MTLSLNVSTRTIAPPAIDNAVIPPSYRLIWRQRKLLIHSASAYPRVSLPSLGRQDWLVECLQRSPINRVLLDLDLGEDRLNAWANACQKANKIAHLRLPSIPSLPQRRNVLGWSLKRLLDWAAAASLLLVLSPLMLAIAFLIQISSPGPIFYKQWRVGERGKLFQIVKFRSMRVGADQQHHLVMANQPGLHKLKQDPRVTSMGRWLRKYSLDELPQLFNVLRGEMSLVGPRPWALYDATRISPELRVRLNALPGITGAWQVGARSHDLDLTTVNRVDLHYLKSWSLLKDLRFLVLTIPKVMSGFGAY
jgi:lipopolysaccharide/colanic/teichoic acid biosynthesis glycosyltransferase